MKIWIFYTGGVYVDTIVEEFKKQGHEVVNQPTSDCDAFLSLQMGRHAEILKLHSMAPHVPLYTYVWDAYEWIWRHQRGYDWKGYGELCKASNKVFVPSEGQRQRVLQHWDIDLEKSKTILAYAQFFEHETSDQDYVCDPLRSIPDKHAGWAEMVCKELKIPYNHGGRGRGQSGKSWGAYKKFIADASFIICPWYEASTGGMSLLEGYNIGKEVLICDSPYLGAKDYFGDRAYYFEPTYRSFKDNIEFMWETRPKKYTIENRKDFCKNFSVESFVKNIVEEIKIDELQ